MRIGLMVGSDKERSRATGWRGWSPTERPLSSEDFTSFWIPQVPGYLDAMTAVALLGQVTERIEIGTAIVPIQTRHPLIMAQQALTTQIACSGRFTLGLGPSHHWIISDQLGLPYERPARLVRDYLDVLDRGIRGIRPGRRRQRQATECTVPWTGRCIRDASALAALGPTMLRIAGERTDGTILWLADERAIGDYVVPRITAAAQAAGRPGIRVVAGVPVTSARTAKVDEARAYASEVLGHADFSPNYVRLLEHGDAQDVGDTMAVGDESSVRRAVCAATATRASPISPSGWCRSDRMYEHVARRGVALRSSPRRCSPNWPEGHNTHELHRYAAHRADEQNRRPAHRYRVV